MTPPKRVVQGSYRAHYSHCRSGACVGSVSLPRSQPIGISEINSTPALHIHPSTPPSALPRTTPVAMRRDPARQRARRAGCEYSSGAPYGGRGMKTISRFDRDRLDVRLVLKGVEPKGRLEASGSFNAMVTHWVRVESKAEVDGELLGWLKRPTRRGEGRVIVRTAAPRRRPGFGDAFLRCGMLERTHRRRTPARSAGRCRRRREN